MTPGRWDDFLRGNASALTAAEKDGLKTFLNAGCMVCHTGPYLGGSMFERVGVVEPWPNQTDHGRQQVTKASSDAMMFKVPTLAQRRAHGARLTFTTARRPTSRTPSAMMGRYQLGLEMGSDTEVTSIVTWLKSLTGDLPKTYVAKPALPPSKA